MSFLGFFIWFIGAVFFLYEFFLRTFVGSIAHQIIPDLHLTVEQFSILGSAYYLAYGLMQIPVGVLTDKFGVKLTMVFATLLCALSTYLFAHSAGFYSATLSRFIMGFGSSFAFICLLVIASNWFPKRFFALFAGLSQFVGTMGPALAGGPLVAVLAAEHMSWRSAFTLVGSFGVVLAILSLLFVKGSPKKCRSVFLFLSKDEPLWQRLKRLFQNKQAVAIASYSACVYVSMALMSAAWGTEYIQSMGFSQASSAYMITISWLAYAIGCPLFGAISDMTKRRKPIMVLCALLGFVSVCLMLFYPVHHLWYYEVLFFAMGLGATGQNVGFAIIAEHTEEASKASALGLNNGCMLLLSVISTLLSSAIIEHVAGGEPIGRLAYVSGLSLMPIFFGVACIIAFIVVKETFGRSQKGYVVLDP